MKRGIYIMANDKTVENSIALLNSVRYYDSDTPIIMIPYDDNYHLVADTLRRAYGVAIYDNLQFLDRLTKNVKQIFGSNFLARQNVFRKHASWFGFFDEFLYLDTDIVVFEKIIDNLSYLSKYDFVFSDYQFKNGLRYTFTQKIIEDKIFSLADLSDTLNTGFWGSKKNLISESFLYKTFEEIASNLEYFDFSEKVTDMPVINYLVLKNIPKRFNIVKGSTKSPGSWAGSPHFKRCGNQLIDTDVNQPLKYLHWAGIKIIPGCPYWDIWKYYRDLSIEKS